MSFSEANSTQVAALTRLRLPEFAPVLEMFSQERERALSALSKADDATRLYRLQGRVQALSEFIDTVESASAKLDGINRAPGRPQ